MAFIPAERAADMPWTGIDKVQSVQWAPMPPYQVSEPVVVRHGESFLSWRADRSGWARTLLTATGTKDSVRSIHVEDQATQANRGDVLKVLQQKGFDVQLARCGKLYQLSSSKWFRVTARGNARSCC